LYGARPSARAADLHPWDEPDTDKETIGLPVQSFAVGRQGDEGDAFREQCQNEVYGHPHVCTRPSAPRSR
jgi:hypothetical protein